MLAHFCCFSSILRLGLVVDCALMAHGPMEGRELAGLFRSDHIRWLDHSECVHLHQQRAQSLGRTDCARGSMGVATTLIVFYPHGGAAALFAYREVLSL